MPAQNWAKTTEQRVNELVAESTAAADQVNLMEPLWGFIRRRQLKEEHRRFILVVGQISGTQSFVKTLLLLGGTGVALGASQFYNPVYPWYVDALITAGYALLVGFGFSVYYVYRDTFIKRYAVERADFTDPSQVTAMSYCWVPRLALYHKPTQWRGNNGKAGFRDVDAYTIGMTGQDELHQNEHYGDFAAPVWYDITEGKKILDFRNPSDYIDLQDDPYKAKCLPAMKDRRVALGEALAMGALHRKLSRGFISMLDGKWPYLFAGVELILAVMILMIGAD